MGIYVSDFYGVLDVIFRVIKLIIIYVIIEIVVIGILDIVCDFLSVF